MSIHEYEIEEKCKIEVEQFKPSTTEEIKNLNLKIGKNVKIQCILTYPFTLLDYVSDEIDAEIFNMSFQNSEFNFCLWFDDDYGNERFVNPEKVKFI